MTPEKNTVMLDEDLYLNSDQVKWLDNKTMHDIREADLGFSILEERLFITSNVTGLIKVFIFNKTFMSGNTRYESECGMKIRVIKSWKLV